MKVKAEIFQIIKWEDKEKFFFSTDFGDKKLDLLNLAPIDEDYLKWYERTVIGTMFRMLFQKNKPRFKYKNFLFGSEITYENKNSWDKNNHNSSGLVVLVDRPHEFKEGEIVLIDVNVSLTNSSSAKYKDL